MSSGVVMCGPVWVVVFCVCGSSMCGWCWSDVLVMVMKSVGDGGVMCGWW